MAFDDRWEGTSFNLAVDLSGAFSWLDTRSATFSFNVLTAADAPHENLAIKPKQATFDKNVAKCTVGAPNVPAGEEYYQITIDILVKLEKRRHGVIYRIWAHNIGVELVPVDGNGNAVTLRAVPFLAKTDSNQPARYTTAAIDGKYSVPRQRPGGTLEISVASPWTIHHWENNHSATAGGVRKAYVHLYEAGFLSPAPAKHEWAVNRKTANNGADKRGKEVTITVARKGDSVNAVATGLPKAVIYVFATFSKTTARKDHTPTLKGVTGLTTTNGGKNQSGTVAIAYDAKQATFKVDLGFAGGETCKIEIGTELNGNVLRDVHETLEFENWREFDYDLLIPASDGDDRITDLTVFKSKTVAALPDDTVSELKKILDPVKVALKPKKVVFADRKTFSADQWKPNQFDDGTVFNKASKRLFVLGVTERAAAMDLSLDARNASTLRMIACDALVLTERWTQSFADIYEPTTRDVVNDPKVIALDRVIDGACSGTEPKYAKGDYPIKKLAWKATHYQSLVYDEDSFLPFPEKIQNVDDPGYDSKDEVELTSKEDIEKHITFEGGKVSFKLPEGDGKYPGQRYKIQEGGLFVKVNEKPYRIHITIQIQGVGARVPLGAALHGEVAISSYYGGIKAKGLALVIAHELGHCMGQAYGDRKKAMDGIELPATVPGGHIYTGKGHQGPHCANGLTNKEADKFTYDGAIGEAKCVMFGEGDPTQDKSKPFCSACEPFVLAEDLSDIRKDWRS